VGPNRKFFLPPGLSAKACFRSPSSRGRGKANERALETNFGAERSLGMSDDPDQPHADNDDDNERTETAKRVAEDYASGLREMLRKLRKWFN